ncbi:MAG: hypothetical protein KDK34_12650 [Leptospiraceae bacterium]|nr:hypothetical protein [Leptospiraceae bacterium]
MSDYNTALELLERIRKLNESETEDPLPTSEDLYRHHAADFINSEERMRSLLAALAAAHSVFTVHLVEPDEEHDVDGVFGYIVADIGLVRKLESHANRKLESLYEQQFYKRKSAAGICRELLPQARMYNNTPLGRALNLSIMTQQYIHLLTEDAMQYTDSWKIKRLKEELGETDSVSADPDDTQAAIADDMDTGVPTTAQQTGAPLIDSGLDLDDNPNDNADRFTSMPGEEDHRRALDESTARPGPTRVDDDRSSWGKAVRKYGVNFLLRMHLRRNEFEKISWLIKTGRITNPGDLRFIRDTAREMETRSQTDMALQPFKNDLIDLRRNAQRKLSQTHS